LEFFEAEKGKHFEPRLIELFMDNLDQFLAIKEQFKEDIYEC
jgi:response regulator RpfG family c-di-GMP phosphodiesterase